MYIMKQPSMSRINQPAKKNLLSGPRQFTIYDSIKIRHSNGSVPIICISKMLMTVWHELETPTIKYDN